MSHEPPVFQPMTADDLAAVSALEASLQSFPWSLENFADSLAQGHVAEVCRQGDELIGFAKSVAESICTEWKIPLEALGEGERFQTFNPD